MKKKTTSPRCLGLEPQRQLLVGAFVLVSLWYLWWRLATFNPAAPFFSWLVYGAEVFGLFTALLHIFMCWRLSVRVAPPPRAGVGVDVFVPTYNESVALVRKTLLAAQAMDYPHRTWLLDDGRRPEMRALAAQLGCDYLTRLDNAHAKAGNLNHALAHSSGELIAVFDADHAPRRDFLVKTLGYFDDADVAFVQTPQDFYNLDSFQHRRNAGKRTVWTEQSLFFRVIQRGKDCWNAAFFCGSCAVVRRSALDSIGGFATGTVTEDLHTSVRLHAKGHKSVYHAEPLAFGLAPESIEPFIAQRVRWGQGAMHVWRMEGLLSHRGLSWAQRLNYFASALTYFDGWQKAVYYVAPVVVLTSGVLPLVTSTPEFLLHFVPYCLLTFWVFEEVGRGYGRSVFIEQYNMTRFAAFAWTTLAWVVPRMKFRVTPKGARAGHALYFTAPQWLVMGLNTLAIPLGVTLYLWTQRLPLDGLIANVAWASVNAALALSVLVFTAVKQKNVRSCYRFPVPLPVEIELPDGTRLRGTADDLSDNGLRFQGRLSDRWRCGTRLSGQLTLPDGPLPFHGEVCWLTGQAPGEGADRQPYRTMGCRFSTSAAGRQRLEEYLFGSDLQWTVNGYTDCSPTPMTSLFGRPAAHALAALRWRAVEYRPLTGAGAGPARAALISDTGGTHDRLVLSQRALPENCELPLDVFDSHGPTTRTVRLHRMRLPDLDCPAFVYRVAATQIAAAAPTAAALPDAQGGEPRPLSPTAAALRRAAVWRARDPDLAVSERP